MQMSLSNLLKTRPTRQKILSIVVILTIGLGWKYTWISYSVPIVIILNILSIFLARGRLFCGNFCPRGAFFDRLLAPWSRQEKIPSFLRSDKFRWTLLILLFGFFIFRITVTPFSFYNLGFIFWMMCVVTTIIGVLLGLVFSHRIWCSFCPVGTIVGGFSKDQGQITINKELCIACGLCERVCPLNIMILEYRTEGKISHKDCIKCGSCISICPKDALS